MAKILIIDDEPDFRTFTDMVLKRLGYDVSLADNGWSGLELYRREHPDIILLDLKMPEMDGIEVLKQIRKVDRKQPVIVLTGDRSPQTERQVRALGVSEFLVKDSSSRLLEDTVKRFFAAPTSMTRCH
ncbi:MAG TPA: response regulator [Nitrospiraceae bacterium]